MELNRNNIKYITDAQGKKTSVVIPLKEYQALMEDLRDLAIIAERKNEETVSHEAVVQKLKNDGLL